LPTVIEEIFEQGLGRVLRPIPGPIRRIDIGHREALFVVFQEESEGVIELLEIGGAGNDSSGVTGSRQGGQEYGDENGDDGDDDQEFY